MKGLRVTQLLEAWWGHYRTPRGRHRLGRLHSSGGRHLAA